MATNKRLEDLFGMAPVDEPTETIPEEITESEEQETVNRSLTTSRKTLAIIEQALPAVQELTQIDKELDTLATKAMESFEELSDLGMQVDSRFAAEIFSVASTMMGHAISAKTAKANRKLKTIELQMKKVRLELDMMKANPAEAPANPADYEQAEGKILSRNELVEQLLASRDSINPEK